MSDKFFTSDTHFGHTNIIRYCNRPFTNREEMGETLIANWNEVVRPNDEVFHLGDFAFGSGVDGMYARNILDRLNGRIYLIHGNHEEAASHPAARPSFQWIRDYYELKVGGQRIVLFHYPMRSWNWVMKGSWHLFGHVHGNLQPFGKSIDIGVDVMNFRPVSFDELRIIMDKQKQQSEDRGIGPF